MKTRNGSRVGLLALTVGICAMGATGLLGCKQRTPDNSAAIQKDLANREPGRVADQAAKSRFTPPNDGKLTAKEVESYLQVRKREKEILALAARNLPGQTVASTTQPGNPQGTEPPTRVTVKEVDASPHQVRQIETADVRAAEELKQDPLEYQWVKGQVATAELALYTSNFRNLSDSGRQQLMKSLLQMRDAADTAFAKGEIDRKIAQLLAPAQSPSKDETSEALRANEQLVQRYEPQILALERWPERIGAPAGAAAQPGG